MGQGVDNKVLRYPGLSLKTEIHISHATGSMVAASS